MRRLMLTLLMVLLFPIISLAAWEKDNEGTRYKNDDGTYIIGWHQDIDGKWYYLDTGTGYMLKNTSTPDGYSVNEMGVWDGKSESESVDKEQYNNKADFEVSAYKTYGSQTLKQFGCIIPVTVYYNDKYEYSYKGKKELYVEIEKVEVSNEGVLYATYSAKEKNYYHQLRVNIRYINEDGTYKDVTNEMGTWGDKIESEPVMNYHGKKDGPAPVSAEVYIDVADVE